MWLNVSSVDVLSKSNLIKYYKKFSEEPVQPRATNFLIDGVCNYWVLILIIGSGFYIVKS